MAGIQGIRKSLDGIAVRFIVVIIIIAFVGSIGWSVFFSSSDANLVAIVDQHEIDINDLNYELRAQDFYFQERFKDQDFKIDQETLQKVSIESLIRKASILNFIHDASLVITDSVAYRELAKDDSFNEEGRFSINKFESIVRSQGYIPSTYLKRIKEDIALNFWREGIGDSAFVMNKAINNNLRLSRQTRDIDFIKLSLQNIVAKTAVADDEIKTFYDNNQNLFLTKQLVQVKYLNLSSNGLLTNIEIDEQNIKDEYASYLDNFDYAVRKTVSHLMIDIDDDTSVQEAISLADDISLKIKSGTDFIDLVQEYSDDEGTKDNGGELGTTDGTVFPPEFEKELKDMTEGEVSKPVQLEDSVHLLKLSKIQEPIPDSYKDKRAGILSNLRENLSNNQFMELLDRASDLTFSLNNLESISKELDIPIQSAAYFSEDEAPDDLSHARILDLLFKNEEFRNNRSLEILEFEGDRAIIISLEAYLPEQIKPFNEVELEATDYYKADLAQAQLELFSSETLDSLNQGLNLDLIAKDSDLELQSYRDLSRNTSLLSNSVISDIFNLPRSNLSDAYGASNLNNGDVIIYKLTAINEEQAELTKEDRESFKSFIKEERKVSELSELQLASQESRKIIRKF